MSTDKQKNFTALEVGGFYRDSYGNLVEITHTLGNGIYQSRYDGGYFSCGTKTDKLEGYDPGHDLIEQVWLTTTPPEPEPVELYDGCVGITEQGWLVGPFCYRRNSEPAQFEAAGTSWLADGRYRAFKPDFNIVRVLDPSTTLAELGCKPRPEGDE